jgi:hypothetical protein
VSAFGHVIGGLVFEMGSAPVGDRLQSGRLASRMRFSNRL